MEGFEKDLQALLLLTFLALLFVFAPGFEFSPFRVVFGLPFVLFLPGYALIAALFPGREDLDGIERVALSFGLSIAVVPLIGLILNYTPFGIRLTPVAVSLTFFTVAMTVAAVFRRRHLSVDERFSVRFDFMDAVGFLEAESGIDRLLSILLVLSILAALGALVYVIATPKTGERFTEFYILGSEGKAADYPSSLVVGERAGVIVGVSNQEHEALNYTVLVVLANKTLFEGIIPLGHNETWEEEVCSLCLIESEWI